MAKGNGPIILGLSYGGHDTAAALMMDGRLVAACEQERYTLDKHSRRFPKDAVADCLRLGGVGIEDVHEIAFALDPMYYIRETYLRTALEDDARVGFLIDDIERIRQAYTMETRIREELSYRGDIQFYRHHLCHLASAYYPSGFKDALLVSYDGMAESETGMIAIGRDGEIDVVHDRNRYPHSLGLLYSAVTHYLGWKHHCDEGIVMGLATCGDPQAKVPGCGRSYYSLFEEILQYTDGYDFTVDQTWMAYYQERDKWVSDRFTETFGPKREPGGPIDEVHRNVAAALQKRLEDVILAQLGLARRDFGFSRLALAGGVSLNCSMNGKIDEKRLFDEIFVQPASGDNGTPVGACYLSHKRLTGGLAPSRWHDFYLGSGFGDEEIGEVVRRSGVSFERPPDVFAYTARKLAEGRIVGWFQGRAEFGPRALGNRSILTQPYPAEMKDHLNNRVKFREYFRPFAPAVLAEHAADYFQIAQESPHMLIACKVRPERAAEIPAVVHVDGTCRVQTVTEANNPRFRRLLEAFHAETGCPVILNTSFNVKGQPMVNTPDQAIACFQSTDIDILVLGDHMAAKPNLGRAPVAADRASARRSDGGRVRARQTAS